MWIVCEYECLLIFVFYGILVDYYKMLILIGKGLLINGVL